METKKMNIPEKKIKVLFVSHSAAMAGAENSLLLLLSNINMQRFEIIVLLPEYGPLNEQITLINIKTYIVPYKWWARVGNSKVLLGKIRGFRFYLKKEISSLKKIIKIIKNEKIDIIYTNTSVISIGAIAAFITKRPHIWHIREIIPDNPDLKYFLPNKMILNFILKYSNIVIANSKTTANQFKYNKLFDKKIRVVYNSVRNENILNNKTITNDRIVNQDDWTVAVIGTFLKVKAQDDAIYAITIARQKIPNIKLLLVGDGDYNYKNYLKNIVSSLKLNNNVLFLGYRNDILEIMQNCKVILIPSLIESFGNVILEAMQCGVPVISTNNGGSNEIITNGINGLLVPPHSPDILAENIIFLHEHPEIANKLTIAGKKTIKEKFNLQNYIQNIEKIIQEIFNKK